MFGLQEINALCEEYGFTENSLQSFIISVAKKFYAGRKNILFFDYERGLFCFVKRNNSIGFFKPRKRDMFSFYQLLKSELAKKKLNKSKKRLKIREQFFENLGGRTIKVFVKNIDENGVFLSLKANNKVLEKFVVFMKFEDFFASDVIENGYNFWVFIKDVKVDNKVFLLHTTRKNSSVVRAEFAEIYTWLQKRILDSGEQNVLRRDDFKYRFIDVSINRKEIVIECVNRNIGRFLGLVAKTLEKRINFTLKWRFV